MLSHRRVQHAVGQGFFHSAAVVLGPSALQYVYDCGSGNERRLACAIDNYVSALKRPILDVLFLSHLDWDHVNGLDKLLAVVQTDTVVIPYLTGADMVALLAGADTDGQVNGTYLDLISNPIGWLGDRGCNRVIVIRGNDPDSQELPRPELPADPEVLHAEGPVLIDLQTLSQHEQFPLSSRNSGHNVDVFVIPHHIPLLLRVGGRILNWAFVTFVHPEKERLQAFRSALKAAFPNLSIPDNALTVEREWHRQLADILRNPEDRSKLGGCYVSIRRNRNLTSMSLYSGPITMKPRFTAKSETLSTDFHSIEKHTERCAWLGTGDANFGSARRRTAFLNHFQSVYRFVRTTALPHHGAWSYFDKELAENGSPLYIASAGTVNLYGHPDKELLLLLKGMERSCLTTTEEPDSSVVETISLRPSPHRVPVLLIGMSGVKMFVATYSFWSDERVSDVIRRCLPQLVKITSYADSGDACERAALRAYDWETNALLSGSEFIEALSKAPVILVCEDDPESDDAANIVSVAHEQLHDQIELWKKTGDLD